MKNLILVSFFLLISCAKEKFEHNSVSNVSDSLLKAKQASQKDKLVKSSKFETALNKIDSTRITDGQKIIKTISADLLPVTLSDEFTNDNQEYFIKIKDFKAQNISGIIIPDNPAMNIRFNQIRLANGEFDGPFGRDITYQIKQKGEIWLIIGKSNMASGTANGKFKVLLK